MRIGFACMRYPQVESQKISTTTVAAMRRREHPAEFLSQLALRNARRVRELVRSVAHEPVALRMVRVGSGMWPMSDHPDYRGYDLDAARETMIVTREIARAAGVRLSFHPDQFNALASTRSEVVARTLETLEIAAEQAELVGASNMVIHCWGQGGIRAFRRNLAYASDRVRRVLVVENDEFGVGTEALLEADLGLPIVLDPHHHWVHTARWPNRAIYRAVRATWPADRFPKIHYSYPRNNHDRSGWPESSGSRTADRAHSDTFYNRTVSEYTLRAAAESGFDVMVEAKHKDQARNRLARLALVLGLIPDEEHLRATVSARSD